MPISQHDVQHYLKSAHDLAARVAKDADRIDCDRQIPNELAEELADGGFFRLLVPRSLGGAEMDHPGFLQVLQVFAEVDASTAWCINQNNVFATASVIMPEQTAQEIWSDGRAVVANGPPTSSVKATPVDGGYRLRGRWNFSTGSAHATWLAALAPVVHPDQNQDASMDRTGTRILLLPKKEANFIDSWQVNGMRGTGSFSFEADGLYVPNIRTYDPTNAPREDGPLYVIPRTLLFASGDATIALSIARASLATAIELVGPKTPGRMATTLPTQTTTHRLIGEAEAIWRSARAYLQECAAAVWDNACRDRVLDQEERIQLRLASTSAIRMAAETVDIAYNLCGSGAIFASNPIQRRFQDIHVITQHAQGRLNHYETAGQFLLGLEPQGSY